MRINSVLMTALAWLLVCAGAFAQSKSGVTGSLTVNGKKVNLTYAYVDEAQPDEPIIVLSDKPLPAKAIPFISEKLIKEQKIYSVAFSFSAKDKKLTNTYGMVSNPSDAPQLGLGRVEDGRVKLTIQRLDKEMVEGTIATPTPVKLTDVSYSFDLTFKAELGKKKR